MLFTINRTSTYNDDKPCDEAFKSMHEFWHTRTVNEEDFNAKFSHNEGLWRSKGKNHTTTSEGWVTRQEDDVELWTIQIQSLPELMNLIKKHGRVIVTEQGYNTKTPNIEIYDDWRE